MSRPMRSRSGGFGSRGRDGYRGGWVAWVWAMRYKYAACICYLAEKRPYLVQRALHGAAVGRALRLITEAADMVGAGLAVGQSREDLA